MTDAQTQAEASARAKAAGSSANTPTGPVDATTMDPKQVDKLIAAGWRTAPGAHNNVLIPPPGGAGKGGGSFNSKHPRVSKGSPTGGQFVAAGGSGPGAVSGGAGSTTQQTNMVKGVQAALGLPVTGTMTPADTAAIKAYQQKHGLTVDGKVGTQTLSAMLGKPGTSPGSLTHADMTALAALGTKATANAKKNAAAQHKAASAHTAAQHKAAAAQTTAQHKAASAHTTAQHKAAAAHAAAQVKAVAAQHKAAAAQAAAQHKAAAAASAHAKQTAHAQAVAAHKQAVAAHQQAVAAHKHTVAAHKTQSIVTRKPSPPPPAPPPPPPAPPPPLHSLPPASPLPLRLPTPSPHRNEGTIDMFRHPYPVAAVATLRAEDDEQSTEGIEAGIDYIQQRIDYIQQRYGSPDAASEVYDRMAHEQILGDKPDSPGLWHHKGRQIPAFMQRVINDLIEGGTPREVAIPRGIGIVKNWAEGHDGKGSTVHPDTVAKAQAAVAEWEALKGATHAETAAKAAKRTSGRHTVFSRTYNLEDISVRSGPYEDGRTIEAYAAVYDVPARIHDHEGEYEEVIDRTCFDRAVDHARPQGGRAGWKCGVFYNHARTIFGTPSDRHSEPIGVCLDIRPDQRGLLTVTKYLPAADSILDAIREGAITSYSFSGSFMRSTPQLPGRGAKYRAAPDGSLTQVRRLESSLREYGPTPFPAYEQAEVVGMRAEQIALALGTLDRDEREQLVEILRSDSARLDDIEADMQDSGISTGTPDDGSATGDSQPDGLHSDRNLTNRLWRSRLRDALSDHGIALPEERQ